MSAIAKTQGLVAPGGGKVGMRPDYDKNYKWIREWSGTEWTNFRTIRVFRGYGSRPRSHPNREYEPWHRLETAEKTCHSPPSKEFCSLAGEASRESANRPEFTIHPQETRKDQILFPLQRAKRQCGTTNFG
jgi:hypothetical protein